MHLRVRALVLALVVVVGLITLLSLTTSVAASTGWSQPALACAGTPSDCH